MKDRVCLNFDIAGADSLHGGATSPREVRGEGRLFQRLQEASSVFVRSRRDDPGVGLHRWNARFRGKPKDGSGLF